MTARPSRTRLVVATTAVLATLMAGIGASPAHAAEIPLTAYFNNVGIMQDPTSGANWDGHGFSYSAVALLAAGVRGGQTVTADGMTFTWPNRASGQPDNMEMNGQKVPIIPPAGATKIGLLGAAHNGPAGAPVELHYHYVDEAGDLRNLVVKHTVTFTDWTRNAGPGAVHPSNKIAITTAFRAAGGTNIDRVQTYVFSTTIPVDPSMYLHTVVFPKAPSLQLFGMTIL